MPAHPSSRLKRALPLLACVVLLAVCASSGHAAAQDNPATGNWHRCPNQRLQAGGTGNTAFAVSVKKMPCGEAHEVVALVGQSDHQIYACTWRCEINGFTCQAISGVVSHGIRCVNGIKRLRFHSAAR